MREKGVRVLAAALMTGAIGFALAMPAFFGTVHDVARSLTAPPSSLQRSVHLVASARAHPVRAGRLGGAHPIGPAVHSALVRSGSSDIGSTSTSSRHPTTSGPSKPRAKPSPTPTPTPKPTPTPTPSPTPAAPTPTPAPTTRDLANNTPAASVSPPAPSTPAASSGDKEGKGKGKGHDKNKDKGKGKAPEASQPAVPDTTTTTTTTTTPTTEESPQPDGEKGHGHGKDKGHDKGHQG
jgi:hypothetical protein